jgi:hypothetical protein
MLLPLGEQNKRMMIRVGFEPTRFLTSKLISGEPETSAITTRPSDQSILSFSVVQYSIPGPAKHGKAVQSRAGRSLSNEQY